MPSTNQKIKLHPGLDNFLYPRRYLERTVLTWTRAWLGQVPQVAKVSISAEKTCLHIHRISEKGCYLNHQNKIFPTQFARSSLHGMRRLVVIFNCLLKAFPTLSNVRRSP